MTIGEKIKDLRVKKGWTQKELAEKLYVTPQALSRWELGTTEPPLDTIKKLSSLFGVSTDELMGVEKEEAKTTETSSTSQVDPVPQTTVIVPIATCEKCGRHLYKEEDIFRYETRHRVRRGHSEKVGHVLCKECNEARNQELAAKQEADKQERIAKGKSYRFWSYFVGVASGLVVWAFFYFVICRYSETSALYPYNVSIPVSIVFGILGYTLGACVMLGNTFLPEYAFSMVKFGFHLPFGLIFDDIVEMFVFKIFLFLLGILLGICTLVLSIVIWGPVSLFVYPFAIVKAYKKPEECWN